MRLFAITVGCVLGAAVPAFADIHLCGDVWTNRDCAAEAASSLQEKPYQPPDQTKRLADRKKFMLNELDLRRLRASREFKINFEIESAREICSSDASSLADCQKAVNDANEQLDKRIALASVKPQSQQVAKVQPDTTTVVQIIDNTYLERNRRHHKYDYDASHGVHHPHRKGESEIITEPSGVLPPPVVDTPLVPVKPKKKAAIVGVIQSAR